MFMLFRTRIWTTWVWVKDTFTFIFGWTDCELFYLFLLFTYFGLDVPFFFLSYNLHHHYDHHHHFPQNGAAIWLQPDCSPAPSPTHTHNQHCSLSPSRTIIGSFIWKTFLKLQCQTERCEMVPSLIDVNLKHSRLENTHTHTRKYMKDEFICK